MPMFIMMALVLLLSTVAVMTWPASYEFDPDERVFEGEVWGDLTAEGEIWSEYSAEFEDVTIGYWCPNGNESLHVTVSNVSNIRLMDRREDINMSVQCRNATFEIVTSNGSVDAYMSDPEFSCVLLEYSGAYPGNEEVYDPTYTVSSVEGHGYLTNGIAIEWYQHEGFELEGCQVIVDGVEHDGVEILLIPDGVTVYIEVKGRVDPPGSISAPGVRNPHVNGSLVINDFRRNLGARSRMYDRIVFQGEDISVRTTRLSQYGTGGPFSFFDQWTIEVTLSDDSTVEVERQPDTPWWFEAILVTVIALLLILMARWVSRRRAMDRDLSPSPDGQGPG